MIRIRLALTAIILALCLAQVRLASAEDLRTSIQHTIKTNPEVLISIQKRLQDNQQLKITKAQFLPTLDLTADKGEETSKNSSTFQQRLKLTRRDFSAITTENLFNGFNTFFNVRADLARISSAAYTVNSTSENIALAVSEVYLNVLRTKELIVVARQNVKAHLRTANLIRKRYEKGISRKSEMTQAQGRLALSEANLLTEINGYKDALAEYLEVVGHKPRNLQMPGPLRIKIPRTRKAVITAAVRNNPTLQTARYNLQSAMDLHKAAYSTFLPSLDVILNNTRSNNIAGIRGDNFSDSILVQLSLNISRGGADIAEIRKTAHQKSEAFDEIRNTEREVINDSSLSWNRLQIGKARLPKLRTHMVDSKFVVVAYQKQYTAGKRTLVDVLNAEAEHFTATRSYIDEKYTIRLSRYRLLNRMALLLNNFRVPAPKEGWNHYQKPLSPAGDFITPETTEYRTRMNFSERYTLAALPKPAFSKRRSALAALPKPAFTSSPEKSKVVTLPKPNGLPRKSTLAGLPQIRPSRSKPNLMNIPQPSLSQKKQSPAKITDKNRAALMMVLSHATKEIQAVAKALNKS